MTFPSVGPSLERQLDLGIEHFAVEARHKLGPSLSFEVDGATSVDEVGTDQGRVGVLLDTGEVEPSVLLDTGEPLVLVETEVDEEGRVLDPGTDLQRVDLGRALPGQLEPRGAVGTSAE